MEDTPFAEGSETYNNDYRFKNSLRDFDVVWNYFYNKLDSMPQMCVSALNPGLDA